MFMVAGGLTDGDASRAKALIADVYRADNVFDPVERSRARKACAQFEAWEPIVDYLASVEAGARHAHEDAIAEQCRAAERRKRMVMADLNRECGCPASRKRLAHDVIIGADGEPLDFYAPPLRIRTKLTGPREQSQKRCNAAQEKLAYCEARLQEISDLDWDILRECEAHAAGRTSMPDPERIPSSDEPNPRREVFPFDGGLTDAQRSFGSLAKSGIRECRYLQSQGILDGNGDWDRFLPGFDQDPRPEPRSDDETPEYIPPDYTPPDGR